MFSWKNQKKPIIAMSPMADMTDSPFCVLAKELGCEIVFREMVSSEAVVRGNEKTLKMCEFSDVEKPIIQQIFGGNPDIVGEAARIIEETYNPEGIDINMGCPAKKIVSNFNGAQLMKDKDRAMKIVRLVKKSVQCPVSVKIRLGWSDKNEAFDFVKYLEQAGADLITIHGRTRAQGYSGQSDWEMIGRVREQVNIPVIANGDINTPERVKQSLDITNCAGVMIARGSLGNPWIFKQARELLEKGKYKNIDMRERFRVCVKHLHKHVKYYGENNVATFRKHLIWYLKNIPNIKEIRARIIRISDLAELEKELENLLK